MSNRANVIVMKKYEKEIGLLTDVYFTALELFLKEWGELGERPNDSEEKWQALHDALLACSDSE